MKCEVEVIFCSVGVNGCPHNTFGMDVVVLTTLTIRRDRRVSPTGPKQQVCAFQASYIRSTRALLHFQVLDCNENCPLHSNPQKVSSEENNHISENFGKLLWGP